MDKDKGLKRGPTNLFVLYVVFNTRGLAGPGKILLFEALVSACARRGHLRPATVRDALHRNESALGLAIEGQRQPLRHGRLRHLRGVLPPVGLMHFLMSVAAKTAKQGRE